jgi:hypothetical protein
VVVSGTAAEEPFKRYREQVQLGFPTPGDPFPEPD